MESQFTDGEYKVSFSFWLLGFLKSFQLLASIAIMKKNKTCSLCT